MPLSPAALSDPQQTPPRSSLFTPRTVIPVAVILLAFGIWIAYSHNAFNWASLSHQLHSVSPISIAIALACSYFGYYLRAWRWSVLLSPICKTTALQMLPSQLIGFTIVGLFGRFADLARPYLIARRLKTSVATQLAVYSIERAFDLAAAAILFSTTLAFAPRNMAHHEAFARAGILSLAATAFLAAFALALRFAGHRVAALTARIFKPLSETFANTASGRILEFSHGLRIVSTLAEFLSALAISIAMWLVIALMYFNATHAFRAAPTLANLSFAATMLLLATSLGGSLLQLPVLGWFTQIAVLAAALHGFFNVPLEAASACGAVILLISNLAVIPIGLVAAHLEGVSLRDAATQPSTNI
ncbi:MAG: flippase-like domain-containing protein [Acidobacteria bacterium]|nr:flippase-like domain-containing protein [Acidobacteriota bacterium]